MCERENLDRRERRERPCLCTTPRPHVAHVWHQRSGGGIARVANAVRILGGTRASFLVSNGKEREKESEENNLRGGKDVISVPPHGCMQLTGEVDALGDAIWVVDGCWCVASWEGK